MWTFRARILRHDTHSPVHRLKADVTATPRLIGRLHGDGLFDADLTGGAPPVFRRCALKRGDVLFAAGDAATALYEVHAGSFKTCVTRENGREQVSGFHIVGDFVGLEGLGSDRQVCESVALEDSQAWVIPIQELTQRSHDSADFQHRFHQLLSQEGARGQHMMFLLGSMSATERVSTFLLDLLERLNARGYSASAVNLSMTRDEIGSYLGLTLETVSRTFTRLKHAGVLDVTSRDIRILDPDALRHSAGG